MKGFSKNLVPIVCLLGLVGFIAWFVVGDNNLIKPQMALAAVSAPLVGAGNFGILSSTYINTVPGTTINGDLGYTTGPAVAPTVSGTTHVANGTYNQAGIDQGSALVALNAQTCDFTFGSPTDLSLLSQPLAPGVYCITGATSIGAGGITLSGNGAFIFRIDGALTTAANSIVSVSGGASVCNIFWTPTQAATLGANSTFLGTIIDNAGITVGSTVGWIGRALAFGGTVTTDVDTITVPICAAPASISVVKTVINDNGRGATITDFPLFVNGVLVVSGTTNTFSTPATYTITETNISDYTQSFSGDCDANGVINLVAGESKVCIVTNNDIPFPPGGVGPTYPPVPPLIDVVKIPSPLSLPNGPGPVTYTYTLRNTGTVPVTDITLVGDTCSPILLVSGDTNTDAKLDVDETWVHQCSTTLTETHTNTVTATGWANGLTATDIAKATVVVGIPVVPPLIHVTKIPNPLTLSANGGAVMYSYTVTNPGTAPLSNVSITDDKCTGLPGRVLGHPGDLNKNNLLESNEAWSFTCQTNILQTTTNIAIASGEANGLTARDFALATVVVAALTPTPTPTPTFPNTGLPPEGKNIPWSAIYLVGGLAVVATSFVVLKRRKI